MEYYLINVVCNFCLIFVIRQFMGDFFQFDSKNRIKRAIFSLIWFFGTIFVNEWLHITVVNLAVNILLMFLISLAYESGIIKKILICLLIAVLGAACDMLAYAITTPFLNDSDYIYSFVFTMQFSAGILFLQIKNTYKGTIKIEDGRVHGKKSHSNHGIGLRSVQDLVREQNGNLNISITDQFFVAEGMIPMG